MAEYIKRLAAMAVCEGYSNRCFHGNDGCGKFVAEGIFDGILRIPTADVVEVRHGEWVVEAYPVDSDEVVILPYKDHQHNDPFCSICGEHALLNGGEEYVTSNYCPNCGAKMDGKGENA